MFDVRSSFVQRVRMLARAGDYRGLSRILERLRGGDWKRSVQRLKALLDEEGIDGVDALVRGQLLMLRRMRARAADQVEACRATLDRVRTTSWMNPESPRSVASALLHWQQQRDAMDAEIARLLADRPYLKRWTGGTQSVR